LNFECSPFLCSCLFSLTYTILFVFLVSSFLFCSSHIGLNHLFVIIITNTVQQNDDDVICSCVCVYFYLPFFLLLFYHRRHQLWKEGKKWTKFYLLFNHSIFFFLINFISCVYSVLLFDDTISLLPFPQIYSCLYMQYDIHSFIQIWLLLKEQLKRNNCTFYGR
jgi:hypothetical protein